MGTFLEITTSNYNGQLANITFFPCSGGSINIGQVTLPYYYDNDYYYGVFQIYIPKYDITCDIVIPCPTPTTPTPTPTPTPTKKITNLAYNVVSCCSRISGVIILPSTFTIGTTILTTGKLCMTITGFAPKGSIPSFTWNGVSYNEGCEECLRSYPCSVTPTPTPTVTKTSTPTPTLTPTPATNYCLVITNESGCGTYTIPTQGNGLIKGKKYWTGTINGNPFIISWDYINLCWVVMNTNTNEICSRLYIDSEYPVGDYTQWVSTIPPTSGCTCLATDTYFSIKLIDCPTPTPTPTNTTTPTKTPTVTPTNTSTSTPTPTPTVTSSPLSPIVGHFQDCCDANIKIKVGSISSGLTLGNVYFVLTTGYTGCTTFISATSVSQQFESASINGENSCFECLLKIQEAIGYSCPTPTPTPTKTTTPTPTITLTPTMTKTPTPTTSPQPLCNNCGISGYSYIISSNLIF